MFNPFFILLFGGLLFYLCISLHRIADAIERIERRER